MPGSNGDNGTLALPDSGIGWDSGGGIQYPQVSGGIPGSSDSNPSLLASIIGAGGAITSSLIQSRSQADLMKYSTLGSNGFLFTGARVPGQLPTVASIGSTTLILIAVATIVVLFLFTRKAG